MDISLKLNSVALAIRQGFSPARLFAAGEQGAWYDPSDLNTLFQDQAGTTPVTAVEQPVSLMLDKSKGGGAIGADTVVNGTFAADSDWTKGTDWSIGSGVATKTAGTAALLSQSATLIVGRSYIFTYTITRTAGTITAQLTGGTTVSGTARSAAGTYTDILTAVSGNNAIAFSADASFAGTVDNVTLRLLPAGNHAYTPSTATASRPVLSARVNLLEKTEQFDDAAWTKTRSSISANQTIAPDGTNTADAIFETAVTGTHLIQAATISSSGGTLYSSSVYVKANGRNFIVLYEPFSAVGSYFDITPGTAGAVLGPGVFGSGPISSSIAAVGNDWFRCSITVSAVNSITSTIYLSNNGTSASYAGDVTNGVFLWGADLRVANDGVGIPNYQRVNTSTDYDTAGFPLYLRCDGTDDFAQTNSVDFSGGDSIMVAAAIRKQSDAALGVVAELSATLASNNGTFLLSAPNSAAANFNFSSKGTAAAANTVTTFTSPIGAVIVADADISSDSNNIRINGGAATAVTDDQGSGNYGNYPIYLFRRGGTANPFNGRFYGAVIRAGAISSSDVSNVTSFLNSKAKIY
jgi:hypothetical protein